jgi:hypothetical protein
MLNSGNPLTLSNRSQASNPGRLTLGIIAYLRCYPIWLLVFGIQLLIAVALTAWVHPIFAFGIVWVLALAGVSALKVREHFWYGCVCPAVVVSHCPDLIAVHTDLTTGRGPWPVVKIVRHPLRGMTGGRPPVGTRRAAVALYGGDISTAHWLDFSPVVVNCATANQEAVERVLSSVQRWEWEAMEEALRQVPRPYRRGLYKVDLPLHLCEI